MDSLKTIITRVPHPFFRLTQTLPTGRRRKHELVSDGRRNLPSHGAGG